MTHFPKPIVKTVVSGIYGGEGLPDITIFWIAECHTKYVFLCV